MQLNCVQNSKSIPIQIYQRNYVVFAGGLFAKNNTYFTFLEKSHDIFINISRVLNAGNPFSGHFQTAAC